MDLVLVSGCRAAAAGACTALAKGYPLPLLTAGQSNPLILKGSGQAALPITTCR